MGSSGLLAHERDGRAQQCAFAAQRHRRELPDDEDLGRIADALDRGRPGLWESAMDELRAQHL